MFRRKYQTSISYISRYYYQNEFYHIESNIIIRECVKQNIPPRVQQTTFCTLILSLTNILYHIQLIFVWKRD